MTTRRLLNQVVELFWEDAKCTLDGEHIKDLPIMRSIGVIIDTNKKRILLCSLFGSDSDPRIVQAIPRSLVKKITHL